MKTKNRVQLRKKKLTRPSITQISISIKKSTTMQKKKILAN